MADFSYNDTLVVMTKLDSLGYTHDSVTVTVTSTMTQGSLLLADGSEAAPADAANVAGAIDDLEFLRKLYDGEGQVAVGSQVTIAVAKRGCILNESNLKFNDGSAIDATAKAALGVTNKFTTVSDASDII